MFDRDADGLIKEEDLHQLHLQARLPLITTGQDIKRTSWLGRQWRRRHTIDEEADIESNQRQWNFGRHTVVHTRWESKAMYDMALACCVCALHCTRSV